ncbi:nucleoside triphosphate pyrophosphohydrolase [Methylopila jiangsuensis]|uniref:Nucleoside triphosphate pyrophosphohydrolase n=1 Tax=Methylopila jiangsuensis TaxID=586230 RepID=A0A9W6JGS8_9HYPH|nr:nucleoside triphosphate pyrophosphohydrolase [Methylopila jiangsuensis]MDR6285802.1 ATP diphosphatase [Methylopila jiangsuensis]GLK75560.1 nucleoside triphosphate pyrophosphohydrolase [Methylopila jiangsuensis]
MPPARVTPARDIARLIEIMSALRTPGSGCAWDLEQSFATIAPYTIEEAYEVADAIQRGDLEDLKDELGDLLLQVAFHARMAEEEGAFAFGDVVEAITAKLIRRHPHVFGEAQDRTPEAIKAAWGAIKAGEKAERAARRGGEAAAVSLLDGVPPALPALTRAMKLQEKAATVGFDWDDVALVVGKVREEIDEVAEAVDSGDRDAIEDEIGDLLCAVANLARHAGVDPEAAARRSNAKFERRFRAIEAALGRQGRTPADSDLAEMDALWNAAKAQERKAAE